MNERGRIFAVPRGDVDVVMARVRLYSPWGVPDEKKGITSGELAMSLSWTIGRIEHALNLASRLGLIRQVGGKWISVR
jgi:hypothetical protein